MNISTKHLSWNTTAVILFSIGMMTFSSACKRTGCMKDVQCVDNFDPKAERAGDCRGCAVFGAYNYCPDATEDNGSCFFIREFYTDIDSEGWVDVWVADSTDNSNLERLRYEGRISSFPSQIPDCEKSDSSLTVLRQAGEYYYEIETQTGQVEWGWVIYRQEGCRLLDVL